MVSHIVTILKTNSNLPGSGRLQGAGAEKYMKPNFFKSILILYCVWQSYITIKVFEQNKTFSCTPI